ncbi:MAG: hypothetical protein ACI8Z7_000856 [Candidatus Nanohaloarchaea archaeon]|jgi:hypothetical protein
MTTAKLPAKKETWCMVLCLLITLSLVLFANLPDLGSLEKNTEILEQETENNKSSNPDFTKTSKNITDTRFIREYKFEGKAGEWVNNSKVKNIEACCGTVEVTRYPNQEPTTEHIENAWTLYNESYDAAEKNEWFEMEQAISDGFQNKTGHSINIKYFRDNETLNPEKPEFLMYYSNYSRDSPGNKSQKALVGLMYLKSSIEKAGEQIGGPLTLWHYHPIRGKKCFKEGFARDSENCPEHLYSNRSPEMLHIWFIDHPEGFFGTDMSVKKRLPKKPEKLSKREFTSRINETWYS